MYPVNIAVNDFHKVQAILNSHSTINNFQKQDKPK